MANMFTSMPAMTWGYFLDRKNPASPTQSFCLSETLEPNKLMLLLWYTIMGHSY